jgi:hypothetical protein
MSGVLVSSGTAQPAACPHLSTGTAATWLLAERLIRPDLQSRRGGRSN